MEFRRQSIQVFVIISERDYHQNDNSYPNLRLPSSPNKFSLQVASAKSKNNSRMRSPVHILLYFTPAVKQKSVRPHPAGFCRPNELFLKFCGPKHTCHSCNSNINPLNVFFSVTHQIETIQYHFLNDGKNFTVKIDSFVSECVSIHRRRDSRVNQIICYILVFNSKTFDFVRYPSG